MIALTLREVRRAWSGGGLLLPVAFFLLVATLFPFAVGPDAALLARIGGGIAWAAALLAALLPIERLIAPDLDSGVVDQLVARGWSDTAIALAKTIGHWLGFAPAMLLAAGLSAALLGLDGRTLLLVEAGLLIGTPGLAALAVATAALVAGLRGGGAVAGLVMLPLALPLVIFGAGAVQGGAGALKLLGATSLLLCVGGPIVAGAALRIGRS
ncbi:cytochrome C biogenesis protein CcmB [Sphingomonas sp. Leaf407]|uniref:heme exporter protein CcmB n=1 Tax=unclassified Sphingomonas TaxID=196159 RepID=UPI0006F97746|nr:MULTISPECIES: heme exporter protein CcmB [unclassified Sphingomonas]KQN37297.1 cytochrome C biogenesis protein CcmB [Sphingomonas sp. Leaf42]KQT27665.1 cytochrome C biogenesis protein CcmB [Sphingomonas sp. Leaf407]